MFATIIYVLHKNKHTSTLTEKLNIVAIQAGLVLMTAAATLGMVEAPEHSSKIIVPNQPAFAMATAPVDHAASSESSEPIRREREETHPHHLSYSTSQRTPGRTGRT